jgi:hypothetical protein
MQEGSESMSSRPAIVSAALALAIGVAVATIALAEGPGPGVPRSFYGVVSQSPLTDEDLDRMGRGEVGTLRLLINWQSIDPTAAADDYDWSAIDPIIVGAARNGIQPLPFVFGTPTWVAQDLDRNRCSDDCLLYAPRSSAALDAWRRFLGAAAARYGPGGKIWAENPDLPAVPITTWQIWNEQNSKTFYLPDPDANAYAKLLVTAADSIRAQDPEAKILIGGMFGTPFGGETPSLTAWEFLDQLYEVPEIAASFDGIGAHPYSARLPKVEEQLRLMRDEVVDAGDADAELWITEVGWSSGTDGNPLERGRSGQATRLREAMDYFLSVRDTYRIANVTWFAWRDLGGEPICDWCAEAGLFEAEPLTPKPSWRTLVDYTGGH